MSTTKQKQYLTDADYEQGQAADLSQIPIIGGGMAAGHVGKAKQSLGKAAENIVNDVELPTFSDEDYGGYSLAGEFNPEAAQYQTIDEDPAVRKMQMDALQSLIDRTSGAADAKMQAAQFGAMDEANQMAKSREGAIRQGMERKGQGGSGLDAVLRAQSAQQGANRARGGMQDAVMAAALEKLAANNGMIQGAGQVRGQDFQRNAANSDIVNRFNQFNTQARNDAKRTNLNARQGINNANVDQRNKSIDRRDRNAQTGFGNAMGKATSRGNAIQGMSNSAGQSFDRQQSANNQGYEQGKDIIAGITGLFSDDEE